MRAVESLEGGLNRNSSPQALATLRDAYDRFLLKFPLLFGYWKKYADLEFNISGPESAEMVSYILISPPRSESEFADFSNPIHRYMNVDAPV